MTETPAFLTPLIILVELGLLYTVYQITIYQEIAHIIDSYRWQSFLLAITTGVTAFVRLQSDVSEPSPGFTFLLFLLIIVLPVLLGLFIKPILARATVSEMDLSIDKGYSPTSIFLRGIKDALFPDKEQKLAAKRIWLSHESKPHPYAKIWFIALLGLAAWVAFVGIPSPSNQFPPEDRFGLFVSIVLHIIGLYNTIVNNDIISQAIGVLTMDQGLYLAVVKVVAIPVPATFFVVSLYAYTLITITLLFIIMPKLRHEFHSIDLDSIRQQSNLEG